MLRLTILLLGSALTISAFPKILEQLPEPGELVFQLNEDEFEDYLDRWLEIEEPKWAAQSGQSRTPKNTGDCEFRVNGNLGQPQPVYIHRGNFLEPTGNSGLIHLDAGEQVVIACTGPNRLIVHPNLTTTTNVATATCKGGSLITGDGWLEGDGEFFDLTCSSNAQYVAEPTDQRCYNNNVVARMGFIVNDQFFPQAWSCFDQSRLEALYVWYELKPANSIHQSSVTRPGWLVSSFFPGVAGGINTHYTQVSQKAMIASLVGQELADKYVTTSQYLARGHLAAKTDFILATGQRASFFFINCAPQWQPFNGGNWNWLEQNLRARIGVAGYNTTVYTGTFGVTQLRNEEDELVDIYLYKDANNNPQLPVPLYFYKVVYEPSLRLGTAFVSINNPYYTEEEVKALTFCTDLCRNNSNFDWLNWRIDNIDIGYSFCCDVDDFRKTVPHLPAFTTDGLLY